MLVISFEPNIETSLRTTLDGLACKIKWEDVNLEIIGEGYDGFYYIDIETGKFNIKWIRLVAGCDLLASYSLSDFGQLYIVPRNEGASEIVEFATLGSDQFIVYIENSEVENEII